jgi:hypothetical protein
MVKKNKSKKAHPNKRKTNKTKKAKPTGWKARDHPRRKDGRFRKK